MGSEFARAIVEAMTTAVLLFDESMELHAINPASEALLELSAKAALGARAEELMPRPQGWDVLRRAVGSVEPLTERDLSLNLASGKTIVVDCTMTPFDLGDRPGVLVELVSQGRHKQITREEQLVAQHRSARAVVRGLAHEIRNPLGGLRGAAQLLEREVSAPHLHEYTQVIVREVDRLQNLLDRMLGPRTPPRMRWINVHEVTERVCALIQAEASSGVVVERDYDPSIPPIEADPELLIQAVLNVARNAVQSLSSAKGGVVTLGTRVDRQFSIGTHVHRHVVRIDVLDDGIGVPEEIKDRIFYPLVTGRDDGVGLGLSITQSLVSQHGGLIECRSEPGLTAFSIYLPLRE